MSFTLEPCVQTPVTSSPLVAGFLSNLPAYRIGVSPLLRGVEIGLVHGLLVTGTPSSQRSLLHCVTHALHPTSLDEKIGCVCNFSPDSCDLGELSRSRHVAKINASP